MSDPNKGEHLFRLMATRHESIERYSYFRGVWGYVMLCYESDPKTLLLQFFTNGIHLVRYETRGLSPEGSFLNGKYSTISSVHFLVIFPGLDADGGFH